MDNGWHSVAVAWDGDEQTVYVDSELVTEGKTICKWIKVTGPGKITVEIPDE